MLDLSLCAGGNHQGFVSGLGTVSSQGKKYRNGEMVILGFGVGDRLIRGEEKVLSCPRGGGVLVDRLLASG